VLVLSGSLSIEFDTSSGMSAPASVREVMLLYATDSSWDGSK
jgi:hypothetical protein